MQETFEMVEKDGGIRQQIAAIEKRMADLTKGSVVGDGKKAKRGRKSGGGDGVGVGVDIFDAVKMVRNAVKIIGPAKAHELVDMFAG